MSSAPCVRLSFTLLTLCAWVACWRRGRVCADESFAALLRLTHRRDELQRLLQRQLFCRNEAHRFLVDARMLVSFFSLIAFTSRSTARAFSPTIMPP